MICVRGCGNCLLEGIQEAALPCLHLTTSVHAKHALQAVCSQTGGWGCLGSWAVCFLAAYNAYALSVCFVLCDTHPSCPCTHQTWHAWWMRWLSVCSSYRVQDEKCKKVPDASLVALMPQKRYVGVTWTPVRCVDLEESVEELSGYLWCR